MKLWDKAKQLNKIVELELKINIEIDFEIGRILRMAVGTMKNKI